MSKCSRWLQNKYFPQHKPYLVKETNERNVFNCIMLLELTLSMCRTHCALTLTQSSSCLSVHTIAHLWKCEGYTSSSRTHRHILECWIHPWTRSSDRKQTPAMRQHKVCEHAASRSSMLVTQPGLFLAAVVIWRTHRTTALYSKLGWTCLSMNICAPVSRRRGS